MLPLKLIADPVHLHEYAPRSPLISGLSTTIPAGATATTGIAVIDAHAIVGEGLRSLVTRSDAPLRWLGWAPSAARLRQDMWGWARRPELVLYDPEFEEGLDPIAEVAALVATGIRVVLYTGDERPIPIRAALDAGASGVALKSDPPSAIIAVVSAVAAGQFAVSSPRAQRLASDPSLTPRLARREVEALELLDSGLPRKVIGKRMSPPVKETTVVTYFNRVVQKYRDLGRDVYSPQDAVRAARYDGHLTGPTRPKDTAAGF